MISKKLVLDIQDLKEDFPIVYHEVWDRYEDWLDGNGVFFYLDPEDEDVMPNLFSHLKSLKDFNVEEDELLILIWW